MLLFRRFLSVAALAASALHAQTPLPNAPSNMSSETAPAAPALAKRPAPLALRPYISCKLPLGPDLLQYASLPQAPMTRPAKTLTGPKQIRLMDGIFSAYAFPSSAPFVNVKAELLPASTYTSEKPDLLSEFDAIHAQGTDTERNPALKPTLNGFEIYGFDRKALTGDLLGMYIFFDNAHRVATTAYFLNAPAEQRKFSTMDEYSHLRDGFLNAYTVCVRKQLNGGAATAPAKPATKKHSR